MSEFDENEMRTELPENNVEPEDTNVSREVINEEIKENVAESETPTDTSAPEVPPVQDPSYAQKVEGMNGAYQPPQNERPQYPYGNYPYGSNPQQNYGYQQQNNGYQRPPYGNDPYRQPYNGGYPQQNPYSYTNNQPNNGYAYSRNVNNTEPPQKKKKGGKVFIAVAAVLLIGVIAGIILGILGNRTPELTDKTDDEETTVLNVEEFSSNATPDAEITSSSAGALSPKEIYEKVKESSVGILVYDSTKALSSEGTGVIMTEDNDGKYTYIVTCAHVISDKNVSIMVQLFSGKEYAAQVIGFDAKTDIGVLRIEESGLFAAEFGDSDKLVVGDTVYAIGNPGGTEFANSFTNGMISAIDRPVSSSSTGYTMECIQHTAAINPGNSGGALVNEFGQVIGINSMKIIADEYEGMGFSVPSSVFIGIVNEIIANGYVSNRPKLGITYVAASEQQSYAMYVAIKGLPSGSIIVYSISEDSDLVNTDVQKGDMITAVNGKGLDDASDLSEVIENSKVGDTITLSIVRINSDYTAKEFDVKVKLVEDRGDTMPEEESTTSSFYDDFFNDGSNGGGNGGYGSDDYEDFFNDFFGRYFNP